MNTESLTKNELLLNPTSISNRHNSNGKTIWVINQHTATPNTTSGHFRHFFLAKEFKKQGYNVILIIGSFSHLSKRKEKPTKQFTLETIEGGVKVCTVKVPKYKIGRSIGRVFNLIMFSFKLLFLPTKKLERPDVILISSMPLFPIINGYLFKKRFKNSKLVLEIRDIWPLTIMELGGFSARNPFVKILSIIEKIGYNNSDFITSVLPHADEHIVSVIGRKVRFKHIPNGIDVETYNKELKLDKKIEDQLPKGKFIVGYTGTLGYANAMEKFIDIARAMYDHKEIAFVIVGDGYLKNQLQDFAEGLNNIYFLNAVPKQQIPALLQCFDVCYIGWRRSKLYDFGVSANKIYDYMYAGKPIVMLGDIRSNEIKKSGCGFLFDYDDTEALSEKLKLLYKMPKNERYKMGRKGVDFVLKKNTYTTLSLKYLDIFSRLENFKVY